MHCWLHPELKALSSSTAGSIMQKFSVNTVQPGVKNYKCVVVGDGAVGKTSMLLRFVHGDFLTVYSPTHYDSFKGKYCIRFIHIWLLGIQNMRVYTISKREILLVLHHFIRIPGKQLDHEIYLLRIPRSIYNPKPWHDT